MKISSATDVVTILYLEKMSDFMKTRQGMMSSSAPGAKLGTFPGANAKAAGTAESWSPLLLSSGGNYLTRSYAHNPELDRKGRVK